MCLGLASGYIEPKEKKTSFLKPYTNFDKIKDMSIDEMAEADLLMCPYEGVFQTDAFCEEKNYDCIACTKQWLESEAEK